MSGFASNSGIAGTVIGKPLDRVDGPLKVTGRAAYATEQRRDNPEAPRPGVGWIVGARVGPGRIARLDVSAAEQAPGVLLVLTHLNAREQAPYGSPEDAGRFTQSHAVLQGQDIRHVGQPVALVVAETLEQARAAAGLVEVDFDARPGRYDATTEDEAEPPESLDGGGEPDVCHGDFEAAFGRAAVALDARYTTPNQIASAMEPHATLADWTDGKLTLHMSLQILASGRQAMATTLRLDPKQVRILSPFIGGGFGSKLGVHDEAVLAALAAIALERPVKVVQQRRNLFFNAPHRGHSIQRIRLGADAEGRLLAVGHESLQPMAKGYPFAEPVASATRAGYACEALLTRHRVVPVDRPPLDSMRAPGEAIGTPTFEAALDELAVQLGLDPLELRLRNQPERDPGKGLPFASRDLERCLREGAGRFGWRDRPRRPRSRRDGRWLVGYGMAAAIRPNLLMESAARVRIGGNGQVVCQLDMTDLGTGSYTILTQIAAESLGVDPALVSVELGDSDFPETSGSGGSFGAGSSGSALYDACRQLKRALVRLATEHPDSPMHGCTAESVTNGHGRLAGVCPDGRGVEASFGDLAMLAGPEGVTAEGSIEAGPEHDEYAQYSYGAQFVELGVDPDSGEIRLRRALGVFSAGRILNAKTARSQLIGGMIFGIGGALFEEAMLDPRSGAFVNRDLAEYHLAVNRDVPPLDVLLLETPDEKSNPLGSKGIGELGICGIGAAIANAVHNASGVRVRDFPITLDKVLHGLEAMV